MASNIAKLPNLTLCELNHFEVMGFVLFLCPHTTSTETNCSARRIAHAGE